MPGITTMGHVTFEERMDDIIATSPAVATVICDIDQTTTIASTLVPGTDETSGVTNDATN